MEKQEKHPIPDRRAVYEKPEVKSFDLSMEQAILTLVRENQRARNC